MESLVPTNTHVQEQRRNIEVERNVNQSDDSSIDEICLLLGDEDRNEYVPLNDIDTSKDDVFEIDNSTSQSLENDMDDTFSPSEQQSIREDIATAVIDIEREQLLTELGEIQNKLTNWQLSRLVEVLKNFTTQGTPSSVDFDRIVQSTGKYVDTRSSRRKRYRKIDPAIKKKLDEYFKIDDKPSKRGYERIALELSLTVQHVRTWFNNERKKEKRDKERLEAELREVTGLT